MIWFLVAVMVVLSILLVVKWNNFYGLVFALGFLAIEILILVMVLSTAKFATYPYHTQGEYYVYREIMKVKVNFFDLKRIVNGSVWLFCILMLLVAWKNTSPHKVQEYLAYGCACVTLSVWILLVDSVDMHERLYIMRHTRGMDVTALLIFIRGGELALVFLCCLAPLWRLACLIRHTRFLIRKKYLWAVSVSTGILIAIFLFIILSAPVKYYAWDYQANDFHKLYGFYKDSLLASKFVWLFLFVVGILLLLVRFDVLKEKSFVKRKWSYRNAMIRLKDLRHVFHSYKNAMFSIECMSKVVLEEYGKPEGEQAAREIAAAAGSYRMQSNKFLNIYSQPDLEWERFHLEDAVMEARKRVGYMQGISIEIYGEPDRIGSRSRRDLVDPEDRCGETGHDNMDSGQDSVFGDYEAIVEMFVNLLNNAREAIQKRGDGEGHIRIELWTEDTLVCASIRDNGEGMDKKVLKNLYTPFFTTRKTFHNWGLGMSQIRKTVDSHQGFIDVDSKWGRYTEFQIAIPRDL